MPSSKFDAALAMELGGAGAGSAAAGGGVYEVMVRMAAPLTTEQAAHAKHLGIPADTRRTIFSGRLDAESLRQVAELPYVSRVSLSQQLYPASPSSGNLAW